jgi:alpha-N-arabinofuranosidase
LTTITAALTEKATLERPDAIRPVSRAFEYAKDMAVELEPYTVAVLEIRAD